MSNEKDRSPVSAVVEGAFAKVWGEEAVVAIIGLKVETTEADRVSTEVSKFGEVEDVFLVTGDIDVWLKVRFPHYSDLKEFVVHRLPEVRGIRDTKTLIVVTTYKESGERKLTP